MNRDENIKKLKDLYGGMRQLKIPSFSSNQRLSDMVETIIELDPYYAGLALSVSEGSRISKSELCNLDEVLALFVEIEIQNEKDREIYGLCKIYLDYFSQINFILQKFVR